MTLRYIQSCNFIFEFHVNKECFIPIKSLKGNDAMQNNECIVVYDKCKASTFQLVGTQFTYLNNYTALYEVIKCDATSVRSVKFSDQYIVEFIREAIT